MAYFKFDFPQEFWKTLNNLENTEEVQKKMLNEAIPILTESLRSTVKAEHNQTGDLYKSIKSGIPYRNKEGNMAVSAYPTGRAKGKRTSGKVYARSKHGTKSSGKALYNDDKLFFLEYGTSKQSAKPVLTKATNDAYEEVVDKLQEVFNEEVDK